MRLPTFSPNYLSPIKKHLRAAALPVVMLLAISLLASCGQQDPAALTPATPGGAPANAQIDVAGLLDTMLNPTEPGDSARFLATMPEPADVSEAHVRNRHQPGQVDTLQTWTYPGVELEVYIVSSTGSEFIKSVRVERTDAGFRGLRVGMSLTAARSAVGGATPLFRNGATEAHLLTQRGATPVQVTLHTGGGELTAFTVHGYLD